ncbi:MAG: 30S ribosomal protein S2, partial [Candidatus Binatota bacterium]
CDPDMVDCKVPGNDDAIRSIRLFCAAIEDAEIEGNNIYEQSLVRTKEEEKVVEPAVVVADGAAATSATGGA